MVTQITSTTHIITVMANGYTPHIFESPLNNIRESTQMKLTDEKHETLNYQITFQTLIN